MSGFSISNLQANSPVNAQFTQAQQSHKLLTDYKAHITTGHGVKSGVMYIGTTKSGESRIYRDHVLNLRSRKGEAFTQMSNQIKAHFRQAYEGKVPPQQFDQLMKQMDAYLGQRHGGLGTKTFARMFDAFERGAQEQARLDASGARALDGEVAQRIQGRDLPKLQADVPVDPNRTRMQIKLGNMEAGLRRLVGAENQRDVQLLGKGAAAQAFFAKQDGQDHVFTLPISSGAPEIPRNDWRHGEMAAASARAPLEHVAQAQSFVLLVSRDMTAQLSHTRTGDKAVTLQGSEAQSDDLQAYEVPAASIGQFMKDLPEGALVKQAAVRMPLASGSNIQELTKKEPLSTDKFHQLQAGLYMAADEMRAAGLVHRDIKPANVMMDPEGRVKLVDLGSTDGVDAQGRAPAASMGYSAPYVHPQRYWRDTTSPTQPGGTQALIADAANDRYACAMTLMTALAPGLDAANADGHMALRAFQASQGVPPGSSFGERFVDAMIAGALEFARMDPAPVGADSQDAQKSQGLRAQLGTNVSKLRERMREEPELRESLAQMFNASQPGQAGDAAWEQLRSGAMAQAALPDSEREALNRLEIQRAIDRHLATSPGILPGEVSRLRELAQKNVAGNYTLTAEQALAVVAQSAQVAAQQRVASQDNILGGSARSIQPGDPVYQSRQNFLGQAGEADYD